MMNKLILKFFLIVGIIAVQACVEETNPVFDEQSFTKVFDTNQFTASYIPVDMVQTADGGYLVLATRKLTDSNYNGTFLLKADAQGNFIKAVEVEESHVNPIGRLSLVNNNFYFFCMNPLTLQAELAQTDKDLENITFKTLSGGLLYPSAAQFSDNVFVLLSYNPIDKQSVLSLVDIQGNVTRSKGFSIGTGDAVEEPIINHFIRTGRKFPFEAGRIPGGLYYFNGFYNFTFSLVFTNLNQDNPSGVVQGIQDDGGFSTISPLGGNKFAAARFNFGDNYLLPNINLSTNGISSSVDLGGNFFPELENNATITVHRTVLNNRNLLVYGSNTRSNQIGLYFYQEASGEFIRSKYLGFSNPFKIACVVSTSDNGLAVCGITYLALRFPRICIIKLSPRDLEGI